jgi:hypothetical protein
MRDSRLRHASTAGALALITALSLSACGSPSVSPRPVQGAGSEPATASRSPAATPSTPAPAINAMPRSTSPGPVPTGAAEPVRTEPTRPKPRPKPTSNKPTDSCYGAVRHDIDLQNTELALLRSMCFHTGGVLRLQGIGPGLVTASPESLVSENYAAGVVDLRFLRPGTVTVTIPQDEQTYTIDVVVVD